MEIALPVVETTGARKFAPVRIGLTYLWRHRRLPDFITPQTFTELVQHRKLHDRDARLPLLADKVRAKAVVADRIGSEWIIPTLWHGTTLPERPDWPLPFVVKSRHGCNQISFVRDWRTTDWNALTARSRRWMRADYGFWLDEWLYSRIPRGIIVEPFVGTGPGLPIDYKFYVFDGRVEYIQIHLDRGARHRWIIMDRSWRRRSAITTDPDPARPDTLTRMIAAAEELGCGLEFARVDLYEIDGHPLFGEMTFYPGSGLDPFNPISLDQEMGFHWLNAKASLSP
ncbi:polysaccharide biosynthesis protein [Sphingomonas paeninsulae]|uniref:Polysaccharide biosynthesis protein n=1 Tax=Sphingomonas paeninsulae TaxID=2319844 RepID=A0A494TLE0_SPHPE|nr:ATP-grasp fold amidoligase family protein [Sphingomonas paeninsulae]AYJ85935.1 polysaccharide biosynthesis protein [Sphingomonas paeninsulae]